MACVIRVKFESLNKLHKKKFYKGGCLLLLLSYLMFYDI
jgi:hypothetical protein